MDNNEKVKLSISVDKTTYEKAYFYSKELGVKLYCNDEQTFEFEPGEHILKYTICTGALISFFTPRKLRYKMRLNIKPGQNLTMTIAIGTNRTHICVHDMSTGKELKVFPRSLLI